MSCFGQMPRWLTSWSKGVVLITSGMDERDKRKRTSVEASKCFQTTSKLRAHHHFRKSMAGTYQLAMRCPVYRRHDSHLGSRTELENLAGDAKGESTSGEPARLKVPMRRRGADCPVLVDQFHESYHKRGIHLSFQTPICAVPGALSERIGPKWQRGGERLNCRSKMRMWRD